MEFKYFSRNGKVLPIAQAVVPLSSIEYAYGFGVYESIRVSHGKPVFVDDHIERLMGSAQQIGLEHGFTEAAVAGAIAELISATEAEAYNLKILLIGGRRAEDAVLNIICLNPLFPDKKLYAEGVKTVTYPYERSFPQAKTLNMLQSYLAYRRAREAEAYDALLVNRKGYITEGTRTNFFCISAQGGSASGRKGTIISPPENKILLGVTRKYVLSVAASIGFEVKQTEIAFSDLASYDGAFLTSTSAKIMPIRFIDNYEFADQPEALKTLMKAFDDFLAGYIRTL